MSRALVLVVAAAAPLPAVADVTECGTPGCRRFDAATKHLEIRVFAPAGATGMLPLQATHAIGGAGDFALTDNPMFENTMPKANWIASSVMQEWACDEQAQGVGSDTIHRVWIR